MRNVFSKVLTGSMIAGAALLVTACGGADTETNTMTTTTDMNASDTMMDGTTNDVTAIDAGTGADANMTMDANMSGSDANMSGGTDMSTGGNTTTTTTTTDANMTNGM